MIQQRLRENTGETETKTKGNETTLSFGRPSLAAAVATLVRD